MTDPFAELGIERRPLLDLDQLRARYLQLAKIHHPDSSRGPIDQFDTLRQSYEILLDPAKRLRALAGEIEGHWLPQPELFRVVAEAMEAARTASAPRTPSASALASALRSQQIARARELVSIARNHLQAAIHDAHCRLANFDEIWPSVDNRELARLASELTFFTRWQKQLDEATFDLEHPVG